MTRDQAYEILTKYMKGEHYITHSLAVEAIMRGLAKRLAPDDVEYWGIAGLCMILMRSSVTGSMILAYMDRHL